MFYRMVDDIDTARTLFHGCAHSRDTAFRLLHFAFTNIPNDTGRAASLQVQILRELLIPEVEQLGPRNGRQQALWDAFIQLFPQEAERIQDAARATDRHSRAAEILFLLRACGAPHVACAGAVVKKDVQIFCRGETNLYKARARLAACYFGVLPFCTFCGTPGELTKGHIRPDAAYKYDRYVHHRG